MPKNCNGISTTCCRSGSRSPKPRFQSPRPFLIYQESRLIIRALRDYLRSDIGEILVDTPGMYEEAQRLHAVGDAAEAAQAEDVLRMTFRCSIASRSNRKSKPRTNARCVCPPAARIVMDQTEALTAIDVNSSRATKGGDIEETAFNTNIEAAEEVARQIAPARPGRPGRDRLHRHGFGQAPAHGRRPPAERAETRSRPRTDRPHLAFRLAGNESPASAPEPGRIQPDHLPALRRPRPHAQRRIAVADPSCVWPKSMR